MGKKRGRTQSPGKTGEERRQGQVMVVTVPRQRPAKAALRRMTGGGFHGKRGYQRHPKHKGRDNS